MLHFNHPDELLEKDEHGAFMEDPEGGVVWVEETKRSISELGRRE